jgi:hypothetical protein
MRPKLKRQEGAVALLHGGFEHLFVAQQVFAARQVAFLAGDGIEKGEVAHRLGLHHLIIQTG